MLHFAALQWLFVIPWLRIRRFHNWNFWKFKSLHNFKTPVMVFKRNYLKNMAKRKLKLWTFQEVRGQELLDNFSKPFHTCAQRKKLTPKNFLLQFSCFTSLLRSFHSISGGIANEREEMFWTHIFCPPPQKNY